MKKLAIGLTAVALASLLAISFGSQLTEKRALPPAPVDTQPTETSAPVPEEPTASDQNRAALTTDPNTPVSNTGAVPPTPVPASKQRVSPAVENPTSPATGMGAPEPATETAAQESDPQAIMKRAAAAYSNVRSMKASFTQTLVNPLLGRRITSRGTIYQQRPDKFLMQFSDPAGDVIVGDGTSFWVYYPSSDAKQVIKAPASSGAGAVDLQAQFLGDPERRFNAKLNGTEQVDGRPAYVITLTPTGEEGYRSLKVWIDQRDHLARRFEITDMNDATRLINLSGLQTNVALDAGLFRFTPPQGARIVERG